MLFIVLFCLSSLVFGLCDRSGFAEFHRGPSCTEQPELSLQLNSNLCYSAGHGCGSSNTQLNQCDGGTWEECMDITSCEPQFSFKIFDGHFMLYLDSTDCTGPEMETEGCLFSVITFGDLVQLNVQEFLETSKCN